MFLIFDCSLDLVYALIIIISKSILGNNWFDVFQTFFQVKFAKANWLSMIMFSYRQKGIPVQACPIIHFYKATLLAQCCYFSIELRKQ